ncbi:hypothetical protein D3C78_969660 [compost metagenome]
MWINPGLNHVIRQRHIQRQRVRLAHETGPYLQGTGGASERRLAVIVTTEPDHGQQILAETCKPTVTRVVTGACLARQVQRAWQHTVDRAAGTFAHHPLHSVLYQIDCPRIEGLLDLERITLERLALGRQHAANAAHRRVETTVGQGLVHGRDLHRRHATGAQ